MRRLVLAGSALSLLCGFAAPVLGQQDAEEPARQVRRVGVNSKLNLLAFPDVRKELKLSPVQDAKLAKLSEASEQMLWDRRANGDKLVSEAPQERKQAVLLEAAASVVEARQNFEALALQVLDRRQQKRLDEIQIQVEGPFALLRPEHQVRLNLDPGQVEKVNELAGQARAEWARVVRRPEQLAGEIRRRRPAARKQETELTPTETKEFQADAKQASSSARELREGIDRRLLAILTKRQRETYQKMRGEPFVMEYMHTPARQPGPDPAK